jgi:hypothetical protein
MARTIDPPSSGETICRDRPWNGLVRQLLPSRACHVPSTAVPDRSGDALSARGQQEGMSSASCDARGLATYQGDLLAARDPDEAGRAYLHAIQLAPDNERGAW